jgi:hypothetical protein
MISHFRVSICVAILTIGLTLAGRVSAQPRHPPPQPYSAEEAAKMLGGPTRITLQKQNTRPADVLEAIAAQAGMTVQDDLSVTVQNHGPISVSYDKQSFWSVLRSLASELKVDLGVDGAFPPGDSETGWSIVKTDQSLNGPANQSGPVAVVVSEIARSISLDESGKAARDQRMTIELLLLLDPKLKPRAGHLRGSKIEFQGDNGSALKSLGPEWNWVQQSKKISPLVWGVTATAVLPATGIRRLHQLKGELSGVVSTLGSEKWALENPLNAKEQPYTVGNAKFFFRGLNKKDAQSYTLLVDSQGLGEETDFGWPPRTDDDRIASLKLFDRSGKRIPPQSWKFTGGQGEVTFRLSQAHGEPGKLEWDLPAKVGDMQVPFEFSDLPLP